MQNKNQVVPQTTRTPTIWLKYLSLAFIIFCMSHFASAFPSENPFLLLTFSPYAQFIIYDDSGRNRDRDHNVTNEKRSTPSTAPQENKNKNKRPTPLSRIDSLRQAFSQSAKRTRKRRRRSFLRPVYVRRSAFPKCSESVDTLLMPRTNNR